MGMSSGPGPTDTRASSCAGGPTLAFAFFLLRLAACLGFIISSQAVPTSRFEEGFVTRKGANISAQNMVAPGVCKSGEKTYKSGEIVLDSAGPCEECTCRPPNIHCDMIQCPVKTGCKIVQLSNECCPQFQCDCEFNGKSYFNGEQIETQTNKPCEVCYCKGGDVMCTSVTCYERDDCQAKIVVGQCCPKYENCPPRRLHSNGPKENGGTGDDDGSKTKKREMQPWLLTNPVQESEKADTTEVNPTTLMEKTNKEPIHVPQQVLTLTQSFGKTLWVSKNLGADLTTEHFENKVNQNNEKTFTTDVSSYELDAFTPTTLRSLEGLGRTEVSENVDQTQKIGPINSESSQNSLKLSTVQTTIYLDPSNTITAHDKVSTEYDIETDKNIEGKTIFGVTSAYLTSSPPTNITEELNHTNALSNSTTTYETKSEDSGSDGIDISSYYESITTETNVEALVMKTHVATNSDKIKSIFTTETADEQILSDKSNGKDSTTSSLQKNQPDKESTLYQSTTRNLEDTSQLLNVPRVTDEGLYTPAIVLNDETRKQMKIENNYERKTFIQDEVNLSTVFPNSDSELKQSKGGATIESTEVGITNSGGWLTGDIHTKNEPITSIQDEVNLSTVFPNSDSELKLSKGGATIESTEVGITNGGWLTGDTHIKNVPIISSPDYTISTENRHFTEVESKSNTIDSLKGTTNTEDAWDTPDPFTKQMFERQTTAPGDTRNEDLKYKNADFHGVKISESKTVSSVTNKEISGTEKSDLPMKTIDLEMSDVTSSPDVILRLDLKVLEVNPEKITTQREIELDTVQKENDFETTTTDLHQPQSQTALDREESTASTIQFNKSKLLETTTATEDIIDLNSELNTASFMTGGTAPVKRFHTENNDFTESYDSTTGPNRGIENNAETEESWLHQDIDTVTLEPNQTNDGTKNEESSEINTTSEMELLKTDLVTNSPFKVEEGAKTDPFTFNTKHFEAPTESSIKENYVTSLNYSTPYDESLTTDNLVTKQDNLLNLVQKNEVKKDNSDKMDSNNSNYADKSSQNSINALNGEKADQIWSTTLISSSNENTDNEVTLPSTFQVTVTTQVLKEDAGNTKLQTPQAFNKSNDKSELEKGSKERIGSTPLNPTLVEKNTLPTEEISAYSGTTEIIEDTQNIEQLISKHFQNLTQIVMGPVAHDLYNYVSKINKTATLDNETIDDIKEEIILPEDSEMERIAEEIRNATIETFQESFEILQEKVSKNKINTSKLATPATKQLNRGHSTFKKHANRKNKVS